MKDPLPTNRRPPAAGFGVGPFQGLILLAPAGPSRAERWLAEAKLAAAVDLCQRLRRIDLVGPITVLAAEPEQCEALRPHVDRVHRSDRRGFHWGQAVLRWGTDGGAGPLAVFGGASAPLASSELLRTGMALALEGNGRRAVVNNLHSSDWVLLPGVRGLEEVLARQPADNGIGWALDQEPAFDVSDLAPTAASRCDLDTPADVVMLAGHPGVGPALRSQIEGSNLLEAPLARRRRLETVLVTPGSALAVIGRASAAAWRALERSTHLWVRLYAEERGMVASGRLARGEVRSLLTEMTERMGVGGFVDWLAATVDGALWDTRVWMAASGGWPAGADRFAADLGWADEIENADLAALVTALDASAIPIVAGGHNVVAGGLMALLETVQAGPEPASE